MSELTQLLAAGGSDREAQAKVFALVYDELRLMAAQRLAQEQPGQTLQPTALVHEVFLRLAKPPLETGDPPPPSWDGRGHFFAAAAHAMRRILIEGARRKKREKRGGGRRREPLDPERLAGPERADDLLALDEALEKLAAVDARAAKLVELHYFAGLTMAQAAPVLGVSERKAYALWAYARSWLFRCLECGSPAST